MLYNKKNPNFYVKKKFNVVVHLCTYNEDLVYF